MKNKRDYYNILGVKKGVSEKNLKLAYRNLVKLQHPDINPGNPNAEIRMKEINEAYAVLSDSKKRAEYDRDISGVAENNRASKKGSRSFDGKYGSPNFNVGDFFSGSFNNFFNNEKPKSETGQEEYKFSANCKNCNGTGRKRVETQSAFGKMTRMQECPVCNGKGKI